MEALIYTSEGDMRKAITTLQSVARLKGEEPITKQDVYDVAGVGVSAYLSKHDIVKLFISIFILTKISRKGEVRLHVIAIA